MAMREQHKAQKQVDDLLSSKNYDTPETIDADSLYLLGRLICCLDFNVDVDVCCNNRESGWYVCVVFSGVNDGLLYSLK